MEILTTLAQNRYVNAMVRLARMYYLGQGVDKDLDKAFYWYDLVAQSGDRMAQACLAFMYEEEADGLISDISGDMPEDC